MKAADLSIGQQFQFPSGTHIYKRVKPGFYLPSLKQWHEGKFCGVPSREHVFAVSEGNKLIAINPACFVALLGTTVAQVVAETLLRC